MNYIDVFNGDADGLCALIQIRLANPQISQLVTGIKRDINLLKHVKAEKGSCITVLDVSFEKNKDDVQRLLDMGCMIEYVDHHKTGGLISHRLLQSNIDLSANTCTSLIVDKQLQGQFRAWAITAAFGDNLTTVAYDLGIKSGLNEAELKVLKQLGICLNYNGYGASLDDLFFHPAELYKKLSLFDTPFQFIGQDSTTLEILRNGYQQDMEKASQLIPSHTTSFSELFILPNTKWARRVSGVFSNKVANKSPNKAHAILTEKDEDNYVVSIRAPLNHGYGADTLASQFPTGGGRRMAAGINMLHKDDLTDFIRTFDKQFMRL